MKVNSLGQIYIFSVLLLNAIMDIDDIRRANICSLEKEAGSTKSVADRVGMSYAQYVNLRDGAKDPRSGKPRGMRKETAWRFEDAFFKPRGWLDQNHTNSGINTETHCLQEVAAMPYIHPHPLVRQVIALMEATDEAGRGIALMAISQALEKYRPIKETLASSA